MVFLIAGFILLGILYIGLAVSEQADKIKGIYHADYDY